MTLDNSINDENSHGIEITKVKVCVGSDDLAAAGDDDIEEQQQQQQSHAQVSTYENNDKEDNNNNEEEELLRPILVHWDSNRKLVHDLSSETGMISTDPKLEDYKFYVHWLLTFGPIGVGVTLYWRGMWTILDMYLFPNNNLKSAWTSLLLGICTGILCHSISIYYSRQQDENSSTAGNYDNDFSINSGGSTSNFLGIGRNNSNNNNNGGGSGGEPQQQQKAEEIQKPTIPSQKSPSSLLVYGIKERIFSFIVAFGAVSYWRGVWYLWDELVLASNPILQNWICLLVGTLLLMSLRSFRSTFAPPMVYMPDDADDLDGLTLEVCDDLWYEPASIVHQRRALSTRQTLRVANLLEWKKNSQRLQQAVQLQQQSQQQRQQQVVASEQNQQQQPKVSKTTTAEMKILQSKMTSLETV